MTDGQKAAIKKAAERILEEVAFGKPNEGVIIDYAHTIIAATYLKRRRWKRTE